MNLNNLVITAKLIIERQACSSVLIQEELQFEEHYANDVIDYLEGLDVIAESNGIKERGVLIKSIVELDVHLRKFFPDNNYLIEDVLGTAQEEDETIDYGIPRPEKPPVDYFKIYVSLLINTAKFRGFAIQDDAADMVKEFFVKMIQRGDKLSVVANFVEAIMHNCDRRGTDKVIICEDAEVAILAFL